MIVDSLVPAHALQYRVSGRDSDGDDGSSGNGVQGAALLLAQRLMTAPPVATFAYRGAPKKVFCNLQ
jgi:hypothetical protein